MTTKKRNRDSEEQSFPHAPTSSELTGGGRWDTMTDAEEEYWSAADAGEPWLASSPRPSPAGMSDGT